MKIGIIQYDPVWENKAESKKRIFELLNSLRSEISLLIFPELTLTGFTMRSKKFAEQISGESVSFFSSIAKKISAHVMAGFIEEDNGKYFNTLVHINDMGNVVTKYRKIHPFSSTGENRHYVSGERKVITEIDGLTFGLSICYDLRFPELYRYYAKERVEAIINIANWPEIRIDHWYSLLKARAIENQSFMIGVNRIGKDKANNYVGWSSVFHPYGEELICIKNQKKLKVVSISAKDVSETRERYPFLNDIKLI